MKCVCWLPLSALPMSSARTRILTFDSITYRSGLKHFATFLAGEVCKKAYVREATADAEPHNFGALSTGQFSFLISCDALSLILSHYSAVKSFHVSFLPL
jgi:hypothetical protein